MNIPMRLQMKACRAFPIDRNRRAFCGAACRKSALLLAAMAWLLAAGGCGKSERQTPAKAVVFNRPNNPDDIRARIKTSTTRSVEEGIAAAILLDTSGSMKDPVASAGREKAPKIQIAQKALLNVVAQFGKFAATHLDKKILVGVYDFSAREGQPYCRQIIKLAPPEVTTAKSALDKMTPAGGTPIGEAMIAAKRDLDATGLAHRHILVITDGENNLGFLPGDVAQVITHEPEKDRAAIYFIAFDIGAELFEPVRNAGGLVLAADSAQQLNETLEYILTGKILVEQPVPPPVHPPFGKP
jgi:hypothetical protein